jgi:peptidoglycan/xylan/chitin deacetylase (PgdA/CDA1 family)
MLLLFEHIYPSLTWKMDRKEKVLYLTFDDGPIPEVTPWVLEILQKFNAKATFFCIGQNAKKHPEILKNILDAGHTVGNHTMNHLNGWKSSCTEYSQDVMNCKKHIDSSLFRPPYGKIKPSQVKELKNKFKIIMWDVLSKDYDRSLNGNDCLERIKRKSRNGSIVVFHDSLKAEERLRFALPETLKFFSESGFNFKAIYPS